MEIEAFGKEEPVLPKANYDAYSEYLADSQRPATGWIAGPVDTQGRRAEKPQLQDLPYGGSL